MLYWYSLDGILLLCIANHEIHEAMSKVHSEVCGAHQSSPKLYMQLNRLGYYWSIMIRDCTKFGKTCQVCQYHGKFIRYHPNPCMQLDIRGHSCHGELTSTVLSRMPHIYSSCNRRLLKMG